MPDDLGDERVNGFVVRDAGPGGIAEGDGSGSVSVEEAGHAESAVVIERDGVDEVVIDAPVDHADALTAFGGSGKDLVIFDDEVAPFDERDSHFAGEEGVLEVGGVVAARGEHDGKGVFAVVRSDEGERIEEHLRVVADGPDGVAIEELGEGSGEEVSVLNDVRDPAWTSAVVFEDQEVASVVADEVGSADVGEHLSGWDDASQFPSVLLSGKDQVPGDDAFVKDLLLAVDVEQEHVERSDALGEASFEVVPLGGGDDSRDEIEREDSFAAFGFAVDVEGDSLVEERGVLEGLSAGDFFGRHVAEGLEQLLVMLSRLSGLQPDFIESLFGCVPLHLTLRLGPHCSSGDYDRWFGGLVQGIDFRWLFVGGIGGFGFGKRRMLVDFWRGWRAVFILVAKGKAWLAPRTPKYSER